MADNLTLRSPMALLEERLGLDPVSEMMARRERLVDQVADLRAKHGSWGTWDHARKTELATIKMVLRAQAQRDGVKVTEASLEDSAHADPRYMEFVTNATVERANLTRLEAKIETIDATIQRANTLTRYLQAEARL